MPRLKNIPSPKLRFGCWDSGFGRTDYWSFVRPARVGVTIPAFSLMWIVSLWEYVQNSEDMAFGKEWLPTARRLLDTFCNRMEEDLVSIFEGQSYWNFYEWSPGLDGTFEKQEKTELSAESLFGICLAGI